MTTHAPEDNPSMWAELEHFTPGGHGEPAPYEYQGLDHLPLVDDDFHQHGDSDHCFTCGPLRFGSQEVPW